MVVLPVPSVPLVAPALPVARLVQPRWRLLARAIQVLVPVPVLHAELQLVPVPVPVAASGHGFGLLLDAVPVEVTVVPARVLGVAVMMRMAMVASPVPLVPSMVSLNPKQVGPPVVQVIEEAFLMQKPQEHCNCKPNGESLVTLTRFKR